MIKNTPKIGALVPIRLASERLPGKALMPICGRPVVYHLLDRICATRNIKSPLDVVVCTTEESTDDPLVKVVKDYGCSVFRGASDDIICRFHDAMVAFSFDAVMQPDGDDPLSAPEYMDLTMDQLMADSSLDYVTSVGLPLGVNVKSFTRTAMEKVFASYRSEINDTGFANLFAKTGICTVKEIEPLGRGHVHDTVRLTLDYQEDLDAFRAIFEALYQDGDVFNSATLVSHLNDHPEIIQMNAAVEKEYWSRWKQKASSMVYVDADGQEQEV